MLVVIIESDDKFLTVIVKSFVAVNPPDETACNVNANVPVLVGVPEIIPVEVLRVKPKRERLLLASDHVIVSVVTFVVKVYE